MDRRRFAAMLAVLPGARLFRAQSGYTPFGYMGEGHPDGHRVAYATFKDKYGERRIDPKDLIAADDINGWVLYAEYNDADGRDYLAWDGGGEVSFYWKDGQP